MNKIICDVCGTSYPETVEQCPICGCVRPADVQNTMPDSEANESGSGYTYVKGGRFSKGNVKKRVKTAPAASQYIEEERNPGSNAPSDGRKPLIATALVLEGNLGLRISDILKLRLCDIVKDGDRYRLEIVEQKTGKGRVFTVPLVIQQYIENYCLRNGIRRDELMFPLTERAIQKQLKIVCDYLGFEGISTHSFRKWYATEIYKSNGFDIALVQRLLQHSSAATTQRYIGIEPQRIEQAIQGHATLL